MGDECMQNTPNSTSSVADIENVLDNVDEERSSLMETEETLFKVPQNKRERDMALTGKQKRFVAIVAKTLELLCQQMALQTLPLFLHQVLCKLLVPVGVCM